MNIVNIGGTGIVNFGASASVSPKSASKAFAGSGCYSTGPWVLSTNGFSVTAPSSTNTIDTNIAAQPTILDT